VVHVPGAEPKAARGRAGGGRRGDVTLLIHKGYELENGDGWVNTASGNHEEQVIKDLLKKVYADDPKHWHKVAKEWRGVSEETTTGVHRLYR